MTRRWRRGWVGIGARTLSREISAATGAVRTILDSRQERGLRLCPANLTGSNLVEVSAGGELVVADWRERGLFVSSL